MIKSNVKRYIRGIIFLLKYIFLEKPRGLDFSLRQRSHGILSKGNHGYALTQEKAFDDIMKHINITKQDKFIDIGCGKGGTLLYASKYPFKRIAGIEIEESLYKIAKKNFEILDMASVEIYNDNAVSFADYMGYNVFSV